MGAFEHFGELVAEILKLAALLVFGALLAPAFFADDDEHLLAWRDRLHHARRKLRRTPAGQDHAAEDDPAAPDSTARLVP